MWLKADEPIGTRLPAPVGKTAMDLVPDLDQSWFALYGRVATTGEPARFENDAPSMETSPCASAPSKRSSPRSSVFNAPCGSRLVSIPYSRIQRRSTVSLRSRSLAIAATPLSLSRVSRAASRLNSSVNCRLRRRAIDTSVSHLGISGVSAKTWHLQSTRCAQESARKNKNLLERRSIDRGSNQVRLAARLRDVVPTRPVAALVDQRVALGVDQHRRDRA